MITEHFFPEQEVVLIEEFLLTNQLSPVSLGHQQAVLKRFCRQYRELDFGISFLNESHSCKWLTIWRDTYFAKGYSINTLLNLLSCARRWSNFIFSKGIIDNDAFFYLKVLKFLQREQEPPHLEQNLQRSICSYGIQMKQCYRPVTTRIYLGYLHDFNLFQNLCPHRKEGLECIQDENLILEWIKNQSQRLQERHLGKALKVLRDFLEFLRNQGLLDINVADQLYKQYPRSGWRGLARVGQSRIPSLTLESLRPTPRFTGPWGHRMLEFLHLKRKLGARYKTEERMLSELDRYLLHAGVEHEGKIKPALIHRWLEAQTEINSQTRRTKRAIAKRFFEHVISLGLLVENPAKSVARREPRRTMRPFIFTIEQIKEIFERATKLQDIPCFYHRGATYKMIFATLYTLGLRISEACRLYLDDIDLDKGLLLVSETKFFKSRLLPLGPRYLNKLTGFVGLRQTLRDGHQKHAPLFTSRHGRSINQDTVGGVLRTIVREMGFKAEPGQQAPCLHGFRHSFAVHRLLRWYQEGEDVQAKLPFLSAFMGHIDINSTQVYLEEATGLLEEANFRFEARFGSLFLNNGGSINERD